MNCLCNLFDNEIVWVIIIALILIHFCGSGNCCSCGSGNGSSCGMSSCCC